MIDQADALFIDAHERPWPINIGRGRHIRPIPVLYQTPIFLPLPGTSSFGEIDINPFRDAHIRQSVKPSSNERGS